jgi:hypothetical protein
MIVHGTQVFLIAVQYKRLSIDDVRTDHTSTPTAAGHNEIALHQALLSVDRKDMPFNVVHVIEVTV